MSKKLSLELPQDAKIDEPGFLRQLNDRLLRIAEYLGQLGSGAFAILGDLDMKGFLIRNLGDPKIQTDAVNVQYGDRRWARLTHQHRAGEEAASVMQTLFLYVPGILAVQSNACPVFRLAAAKTPTEFIAMVKDAPIGSALVIQVQVDGVTWSTATIAAGTKVFSTTAGLTEIVAQKDVVVNITAVGSSLLVASFPGAHLSLLVRWPG